jgi:hypothetical protein
MSHFERMFGVCKSGLVLSLGVSAQTSATRDFLISAPR